MRFLLLLFLTFATSAMAQTGLNVQAVPVMPVQIVPEGTIASERVELYDEADSPNIAKGKEDQILVEDKVCQLLVEYQPAQDVEYQPGVDVNGNAVVPADLNANPIKAPDVIEFNIAVDAFDYLGLVTQPGIEGDINIGKVRYQNNQLYFNDEPLKPEGEQALYALCDKEDKTDEYEAPETATE